MRSLRQLGQRTASAGGGAEVRPPHGILEDGAYDDAPILKSFVEQSGHTPCTAGRPFFIVTCAAFLISFFALHFTQYASGIESLLWSPEQAAVEGPLDRAAKARP